VLVDLEVLLMVTEVYWFLPLWEVGMACALPLRRAFVYTS